MKEDIRSVIIEVANERGVDPALALAIARTESAGDPFAIRFEPRWRYYWRVSDFAKACRITEDTERTLQACSWGLMQVMGSVARELGHSGNLLELVDPRVSLRYSCQHLARLVKLNRTLDDAIASYNAGSPRKRDGHYVNQAYVDKVRSFLSVEFKLT